MEGMFLNLQRMFLVPTGRTQAMFDGGRSGGRNVTWMPHIRQNRAIVWRGCLNIAAP